MKKDESVVDISNIAARNDYAEKAYGKFAEETENFSQYIKITIEMAKKEKNYKELARGYRLLAARNMMKGQINVAFGFLKIAESILNKYQLESAEFVNLYNTYIIYYGDYKGDYDKTMEYTKKALSIAEEINDKALIMLIKANMGVMNMEFGFYDSAKEFLTLTTKYYETINDEIRLSYSYDNLAETCYYLGEIDKATQLFEKAMFLADKNDEVSIIQDSTSGLARIYCDEEDYEGAIKLLLDAIESIEKVNNIQFEIETVFELVKVYNKVNRNEEAVSLLTSYEDRLMTHGNKETIMSYYKNKADISKALNDYKVAYESEVLYHAYYEELNHKKSEHSMNELIREEYNKAIYQLETIAKIGRELTMLSNVDEVLFEVKNVLSDILPIDVIGIVQLKDEHIHYTHYIINDEKVKTEPVSINNQNSLAAWCINNKQMVCINDVENDYKKYINEISNATTDKENNDKRINQVKSLIYTPLVIKEEIMGAFTIQSYKKEAYMSEELEIFRIISAYVAIAFKNVSQSMALERLTVCDFLTGILNRRGVIDYYDAYVVNERREIKTVAIIMLDLDYFKTINDTYGHIVGDMVLSSVAKVLSSKETRHIKSSRLGGEEFALIVFNKELEEVGQLAESIRGEIEKLILENNGEKIEARTSVGVTFRNYEQSITFNQLYHEADVALYEAKRNGRNQVVFY